MIFTIFFFVYQEYIYVVFIYIWIFLCLSFLCVGMVSNELWWMLEFISDVKFWDSLKMTQMYRNMWE